MFFLFFGFVFLALCLYISSSPFFFTPFSLLLVPPHHLHCGRQSSRRGEGQQNHRDEDLQRSSNQEERERCAHGGKFFNQSILLLVPYCFSLPIKKYVFKYFQEKMMRMTKTMMMTRKTVRQQRAKAQNRHFPTKPFDTKEPSTDFASVWYCFFFFSLIDLFYFSSSLLLPLLTCFIFYCYYCCCGGNKRSPLTIRASSLAGLSSALLVFGIFQSTCSHLKRFGSGKTYF